MTLGDEPVGAHLRDQPVHAFILAAAPSSLIPFCCRMPRGEFAGTIRQVARREERWAVGQQHERHPCTAGEATRSAGNRLVTRPRPRFIQRLLAKHDAEAVLVD